MMLLDLQNNTKLAKQTTSQGPQFLPKHKKGLYLTILLVWASSVIWFHPRLVSLLDMAQDTQSWLALAFFIFFIELAWLYGFYNIFLIIFAKIYQYRRRGKVVHQAHGMEESPVAVLYTTCNDFVAESAQSCVEQDYPNYTVYILDDSSDPGCKNEIDAFALRYGSKVKVVRRANRKGFKAGNLNNALSTVVTEPFFAIADADEILPKDFLTRLVQEIQCDEKCGFVQANHVSNPHQKSKLARSLGVGIDIHWKWHQPLRNEYGFVMFLGHGALIRRSCWEIVQGFPEIVSEDLAFAIRIREQGYRGKFVEDVICYEDFPDTIRAFRIRHMKWTRGTCEFLFKEAGRLLRAPNITWMEKLDIFFPTMNLPLTFFYFLFMIDANLFIPQLFGESRVATLVFQNLEFQLPVMALNHGFTEIFTLDFFLITLMTFLAPVLCFVISLSNRPLRLWQFLSHSTAVYAALSPLSTLGTLSYMATQKAQFLVTGDTRQSEQTVTQVSGISSFGRGFSKFFNGSHPDLFAVQAFEIATGMFFALLCLTLFQISFFGLCLAFMLLPIMHHIRWDHPVLRVLVHIPFLIIILGIGLSSLAAIGLQTVFFGYGFHF